MFQGLIALVDCPEEVGGFIAVCGSARYTQEHWVKEHKPYSNENTIVRFGLISTLATSSPDASLAPDSTSTT